MEFIPPSAGQYCVLTDVPQPFARDCHARKHDLELRYDPTVRDRETSLAKRWLRNVAPFGNKESDMTRDRAYFVLFILMLTSISCKENPTESNHQSIFSGTIQGWHSEGYDSLDLQVRTQTLAQAPVDSTGYFEATLPFPKPADSLLTQFSSRSDSNTHWQIIDDRTFSDSTAKYACLNFVGYTRHHIGFSLYAGNNFLLADSGAAIGDFHVSYFYFNKPTKITGSYTWTFQDSILIRSFRHTESVTKYDLDLMAGWNAITTRITSDDTFRRVYTVSTMYPLDTKWFIGWTISANFELAALL